ncbi:hypothetical protein XAUB_28510 [Xanthomonas citri pv. aurantifolii str. ICPB 11122]|nr:hypothetical protein XAUB_28510 [Xanthomonas citri pv. aurantifolii str. ICPB 11122]EFF47387.1 hypothetical protein XAUC_22450 [Xanthomonas citri pv. aurantifolii str. ICPB 10535]
MLNCAFVAARGVIDRRNQYEKHVLAIKVHQLLAKPSLSNPNDTRCAKPYQHWVSSLKWVPCSVAPRTPCSAVKQAASVYYPPGDRPVRTVAARQLQRAEPRKGRGSG